MSFTENTSNIISQEQVCRDLGLMVADHWSLVIPHKQGYQEEQSESILDLQEILIQRQGYDEVWSNHIKIIVPNYGCQ